MAFSAIIVGNGPSIIGSHRGHFIDSHDYVIRLGAFRKAYNIWDYGRKTNAIMIPNTLCWRMIGHSYIPGAEIWIGYKEGPKFSTIGVTGGSTEEKCGLRVPETPMDIIRIGNSFSINNVHYFSILFKFYKDIFKDHFPDGYFFSKGTMAALIAMDYLMPNKLVLIGCDNLAVGNDGLFKSHRYNFETNEVQYSEVNSNHSYNLEHDLIEAVKNQYPVEVVYV